MEIDNINTYRKNIIDYVTRNFPGAVFCTPYAGSTREDGEQVLIAAGENGFDLVCRFTWKGLNVHLEHCFETWGSFYYVALYDKGFAHRVEEYEDSHWKVAKFIREQANA